MKKSGMAILAVFMVIAATAQDRSEDINRILSAPVWRVRTCRTGAVRMELRGVYVYHGLLWFPVRVSNGSVFDWRASPMRLSIRDGRVLRRRARQELSLPVIARREVLVVRSDSSTGLCYGVAPRLPRKGQYLVLEYGERNGDRLMRISLSWKDILRAKKLE